MRACEWKSVRTAGGTGFPPANKKFEVYRGHKRASHKPANPVIDLFSWTGNVLSAV